jgi:hypothetical protein
MSNRDKDRLLELLNKCGNALLKQKDTIYLGSLFHTYEELGEFLLRCAKEMDNSEYTHVRELWFVFAPTGDFDDAVGNIEFAEEVYSLLNKLYKGQL